MGRHRACVPCELQHAWCLSSSSTNLLTYSPGGSSAPRSPGLRPPPAQSRGYGGSEAEGGGAEGRGRGRWRGRGVMVVVRYLALGQAIAPATCALNGAALCERAHEGGTLASLLLVHVVRLDVPVQAAQQRRRQPECNLMALAMRCGATRAQCLAQGRDRRPRVAALGGPRPAIVRREVAGACFLAGPVLHELPHLGGARWCWVTGEAPQALRQLCPACTRRCGYHAARTGGQTSRGLQPAHLPSREFSLAQGCLGRLGTLSSDQNDYRGRMYGTWTFSRFTRGEPSAGILTFT